MASVAFGLALLAFILIGPWVVAFRALRAARRNATADDRLRALESRLDGLQSTLDRLRSTFTGPESESRPENFPDVASVNVTPLSMATKAAAASAAPPAAPAVVVAVTKPHQPERPQAPAPVPEPQQVATATTVVAEKLQPDVGLEEKVGTNWLNKIGIVLLVLGVAFLISTLMKTLGPAGKVLVGFAVSAALLVSGSYFERIERYRVLARAGIGGGWALLFFTAYAMHHVAAARVIESQTFDLLLMMAVAAGMVWHTLRYNSQVVTGLAFLLAFLTVNIGRGSVFSLTSGVVLAAALSVFVVRRRWFELEIFAILATYLNHWFWLRPIIEAMGPRRHVFPQFVASAAILCSYWLIFRASYVLRRTDAGQERISTFAALLNGGLLLAVMRYQSVRPELAFWFLLVLGIAELVLAQLPVTRRRRAAFIVLTAIGAALVVAAIPFRYSGMSLAVLWIAEAQALLMAGIGTDEPVFRRLGLLAMAPPLAALVFRDAARAAVAPDPKLAVVCAFAALACYADAEWFPGRWPRFAAIYERRYLVGLSYAGMIMAMLAAWAGFHDAWVGTLWALLGFVLALLGNRLRIATLSTQANILAAGALVRVLTVNVEISGRFHALGLRLITVACIAALFYLSAPWTAIERRGRVPAAYTWAGSFLVMLLAWYELRPISVALAWALFGLVLLEIGLNRRMRDLSAQGLAALAAAFTRVFFVNLNAAAAPGQLSPRIYTVVPLALIFYYAYERLRSPQTEVPEWQTKYCAPALCWFGTIALAAVARFELNVDWVVAAWAGSAVVLLLAALALGRRIFLHQALITALAVLLRGIFHNFYERSYFAAHWAAASQAVIVAAALLVASLPLTFRLRERAADADVPGQWQQRALRFLEGQPHQLLFFVPLVLATALLALELRSGVITVAWGIEGVIVFLAALWVGERSYRLAGLGLLLLCVAKILAIDVWKMQGTDRYLTLIVTGSALLLVSFLYSRYRETLREYL